MKRLKKIICLLGPRTLGFSSPRNDCLVYREGNKTITEELVIISISLPDDNGWVGSAAIPWLAGGHPHCPSVGLTCPGEVAKTLSPLISLGKQDCFPRPCSPPVDFVRGNTRTKTAHRAQVP